MTGVIRQAANLGFVATLAACAGGTGEGVSIWFPRSSPERDAYLQSERFQEILVARCEFDQTEIGGNRYDDRLPFDVVLHDETGEGGYAISNGYDTMEMMVRTVEEQAEVYSSMYYDRDPSTVIRINNDRSADITLRSLDGSALAKFVGSCEYGAAHKAGAAS